MRQNNPDFCDRSATQAPLYHCEELLYYKWLTNKSSGAALNSQRFQLQHTGYDHDGNMRQLGVPLQVLADLYSAERQETAIDNEQIRNGKTIFQ